MRLGLGTVQFGVDYGLSNTEGQVPAGEVAKILDKAEEIGITTLDTAPVYGTSEEALGKNLKKGHSFRIITKTPKIQEDSIGASELDIVEKSLKTSLARLQQTSLYGLLLHDPKLLFKKNSHKLIDKMMDFKKKGLIQKIGVSVYIDKEIDYMIDNFSMDLIQVPISVFDQRLLQSGHLLKLKKAGMEIHARSIFLQGLLLMKPETLPPFFDPIKDHMKKYNIFLKANGLSPVQSAIGFIKQIKEIDVAVCGVNSVQNLQEIYDFSCATVDFASWEKYALHDNAILNPMKWQV